MSLSAGNLNATAAPEGAAVAHRDLRSEYGLACPQCGQAQTLNIVISSDATITVDGIDNDDHLFWDGDNQCSCPACSYEATVAAFSTEKGGAQAPAEAQALKKYRVSFTDCRYYYYDVEAVSEDSALKTAEQRAEDGDEGTDHNHGSEYAVWSDTEVLS
ncbi:MAG: hypothetical protein ACLPPF_21270 [Rhodomicrobium sp.]